ncbi:hypothetical protein ACFL2V_01145 [Pseudomonadota bacterium]
MPVISFNHGVRHILRLLGVGALFMLLSGCVGHTEPEAPIDSSSMQAHVFESQKLRRVMGELYFDMHTEERSVQEFNEFRSRHAFHLVEALEKMSVEIIDMVNERNGLEPDRKDMFKIYALRLRGHATDIRGLIYDSNTAQLNGAIDKVVESCDGCHKQLRFQSP